MVDLGVCSHALVLSLGVRHKTPLLLVLATEHAEEERMVVWEANVHGRVSEEVVENGRSLPVQDVTLLSDDFL